MTTKILLVAGLAAILSLASFMVVSNHHTNNISSSSSSSLTLSDVSSFSHVPELHLRLAEFNQWTTENQKMYSRPEAVHRFGVWLGNYDIVQQTNAKNLSYYLGMNQFADLTLDEFKALYLGFDGEKAMKEERNETILEESLDIPSSIDWRSKGAVGFVRNQGQCGACWAFASCSGLEALHKIKKGTLPNYSEQQLIDCSGSYGNNGCNGGTMNAAFSYVRQSGIMAESSYYFKGYQMNCAYNSGKVSYRISGYNSLQQSYSQIQNAVAMQPVTVGIAAGSSVYQLYRGGVVTSSGCGTGLDHANTIVGYVTGVATNYWIVRNQWGKTWGENGYLKVAMAGGAGVCGINMMASYPTA